MKLSGRKWCKSGRNVEKVGMDLLIGEFNVTMDDKGRFGFPSKLRSALGQEELFVTQGLDHCLMLFTSEEWLKLVLRAFSSLVASLSPSRCP